MANMIEGNKIMCEKPCSYEQAKRIIGECSLMEIRPKIYDVVRYPGKNYGSIGFDPTPFTEKKCVGEGDPEYFWVNPHKLAVRARI